MLTRQLGPFGAWALALGCIIGWGAFVMPGTTFLPAAGPLGSAIAFALAGAIMALIALSFHFMVNRYPVDGGSYVFARETFGRNHGFVCAWAMVLAYVAVIPLNATALGLISRNLMSGVLETSLSYSVLGYETYLPEVLLMAVVITLIAYLVLCNGKLIINLQTFFVLCMVGGVLVISVAAFLSPEAAAENLKPIFGPDQHPAAGILKVMALAPFTYLGFDALAQMSGETSFSPRKTGTIMISSIVVGGVLYIALSTLAASVIPEGYASWVEYVADTSNLTGASAIPVFNATYTTLGDASTIVMSITALGGILTCIIGFFLASTRLLYTMAKNGSLPNHFARLHPHYHSPISAILLVGSVAIVFASFGRTILNWIVGISAVGSAIGLLYTCAAVTRIATTEGNTKWRAIGITGIVASVGFIALLLLPNPLIGNTLSVESYVFLFAWAALGVNLFSPHVAENNLQLTSRNTTQIDN